MANQQVDVPFLNVGATYVELQDEIDGAYRRVMERGSFVLGPEVTEFEAEFAHYTGATSCVGVANGLDALILALRALEVGPGHEVIVPSNTFIATWLAVSAVGATPVPAEPDPATHLVTAASIEGQITSRTRALLPVHLYGQPADMGSIGALARSCGLAVVADAAQAHGARFDGGPIGALGDVVCWSFYPGKNLGAFGDGGAVTTNDSALADRIRLLGNYGSPSKYVHESPGVNSRLDELQAAILRVKLARLDEWNARRQVVADHYLSQLADVPSVILPRCDPSRTSVWHLFVVRHPERDELQSRLASRGIQTGIHYPIPPHRQAAYAPWSGPAQPIADELAAEVLSLPIGPHLTDSQLEAVIQAVRDD